MKLVRTIVSNLPNMKQDALQVFVFVLGYRIWSSIHLKTSGWFRLFGRGLTWKYETEELTFSERMGHTKYIKINGWIIKYLKKRNHF